MDCANYDMDVTKFVPFPGCTFKLGQLPFINWLEYPADPSLLEIARSAQLPASFKQKGGGQTNRNSTALSVKLGTVRTIIVFLLESHFEEACFRLVCAF